MRGDKKRKTAPVKANSNLLLIINVLQMEIIELTSRYQHQLLAIALSSAAYESSKIENVQLQ
jgi:hypothetical protein